MLYFTKIKVIFTVQICVCVTLMCVIYNKLIRRVKGVSLYKRHYFAQLVQPEPLSLAVLSPKLRGMTAYTIRDALHTTY